MEIVMYSRKNLYSLVILFLTISSCGSDSSTVNSAGSGNIDDSGSSKINRINPSVDLEYLGAFRVPVDSSSSYSWSWISSSGLTFNADGNGGKGSLISPPMIVAQSANFTKITEFTIPEPIISLTKDVSELNVANTIHDWTDITEGKYDQNQNSKQVTDIEIVTALGSQNSDKLYWATIDWYDPPQNFPTLGMSDSNFNAPVAKGPWVISGSWAGPTISSAKTSRYLFKIPQAWADQYVMGYTLASGQDKINGGGSRGACIYAVKPWETENPSWTAFPKGSTLPVPNDAQIDSIELLCPGTDIGKRRNFDKSLWDDFSYSDGQNDAVWVDNETNGAIIFSGAVAYLPAKDTGDCDLTKGGICEYYKTESPHWVNLPECLGPPCEPSPDTCPGHDFHGEPYFSVLWFYDINDITAVAEGEKMSWGPQPYVIFNLENYLFDKKKCDGVGGITYDSIKKRIYILENKADASISAFDKMPIIHVFAVKDSGLSPDRKPPSVVADVSITTNGNSINLSWSAATDNIGPIMYIVHRNGIPVAATVDTFYTDENISYFDPPYSYTIEARDVVNNISMGVAKTL
jgi:hypothetical protein